MGAGGSHPQATMMSDPWATGNRHSASEKQTMTSAPSEMSSLAPLSQESFVFPRRVRGAPPKSTTRAQDNAAMLEETLSLFVKATDFDETATREQEARGAEAESRTLENARGGEATLPDHEKGSVGVLQKAAKLQTKEARGFRRGIQAEGDDWILPRQP